LGRAAIGLLIGLPLIGWLASGASLTLDMPELKGFNFTGGLTLTPEFAALLLGLVIYTAAFIAEVVRSGIQAVGTGQWEAAGALGLRRPLALR
ncbi:amino acid ABC transporter permease, partial [Salmonella enterica]|nr:amino acid ABC transporter permease [Salmonella enterica]